MKWDEKVNAITDSTALADLENYENEIETSAENYKKKGTKPEHKSPKHIDWEGIGEKNRNDRMEKFGQNGKDKRRALMAEKRAALSR